VHADTREVRPGDGLDWPSLAAYLRWHLADDQVPGLRLSDDMHVLQFAGGHSNLTYLIRFGGGELVIRRPPHGPVPARAHDMGREYRWLAALHPSFPLAPRPLLLCEDLSVTGCVFYVMERRRGTVVRHDEPMALAGHPETRQRLSDAVVDTLVDLHDIDVSNEPIAVLGKPSGFVERQVRGWHERWIQSRLEPVPELDEVAGWLVRSVPPESTDHAVVHGDLKLDNVVLNPLDPARITAVLDWEMAALGDPLVDLGILLAYWSPSGSDAQPDALSTVTAQPGYRTPEELVSRYAERSGRDVSRMAYYEAFAVFKVAVVIQQLHTRYRRGQTDDPRFERLGTHVRALGQRAHRLVEGKPRRLP
jgi:aminoglycoside phosphotransferase (APT) family kinase protein